MHDSSIRSVELKIMKQLYVVRWNEQQSFECEIQASSVRSAERSVRQILAQETLRCIIRPRLIKHKVKYRSFITSLRKEEKT